MTHYSSFHKRALVSAGAVGLVAAMTLGGASHATQVEPSGGLHPLDVTHRITDGAAFAHLEAIYEIAMANDGHRAAGSPGYAQTIDYVEEQLQEAGYETWRQPVPFTYTEVLADEVTQLTPTEQDLANNVLTGSPGTGGPVTGNLAIPEVPLGCTAADWGEDVDLTGQIALVQRGVCPFSDKSIVAGSLGAEALLIYNNVPGPLTNATLGATLPEHIATTGLSDTQGAALLADLADGDVQIRVDLDVLVEERTDDNLFAETPSGDPDNLIVLGAHADGVPAGPGIHDNASGTAAVLEIARQLHDEPVQNKVRFAFWAVEEIGLLGSYYYIDQLSDTELAQHKATVNLDMVAPLDHQNTLGIIDGEYSGQLAGPIIDYLESVDHPWGPRAPAANSDHWPFILAGIPATGIIAYYDDNYHTIDDDLDNVSAASLGNGTRSAAVLTVALGYDVSLAQDRPDFSIDRIAGDDRYQTAAAVSASAGSTDRVFLASGQGFADALAVAPVAAQHDQPVLLTRPDRLTNITATTLIEAGTQEVVIVGGTPAVAPRVQQQVEALGIEVTRVAGNNRYETAAALAQLDRTHPTDTVFVTTGTNYPDALSIGALAGATRDPVLLVRPDHLPAATAAALTAVNPRQIVVVGGPESVSDPVLAALAAFAPTSRVAGGDRYETSAAVASQFVNHGVAYVVTGETYADSLAASAVAGAHPAPLVLTASDELSEAAAAVLLARAPHTVHVIGSSAAVDDAVLEQIEALIGVAPDRIDAAGAPEHAPEAQLTQ